MENFVKITAVIVGFIVTPIVNGFVLSKLWAWFIVPTFNADQISIVEAIGITLIFRFIDRIQVQNKKDDDHFKQNMKSIGNSILIACIALCLGWVVSMFM